MPLRLATLAREMQELQPKLVRDTQGTIALNAYSYTTPMVTATDHGAACLHKFPAAFSLSALGTFTSKWCIDVVDRYSTKADQISNQAAYKCDRSSELDVRKLNYPQEPHYSSQFLPANPETTAAARANRTTVHILIIWHFGSDQQRGT